MILGITDSACKNQLVMVSIQYGPFNTYIPIRSTTIGKSRVAKDPITMHTSWRSNSDITSVTRQTHLPKTHPVLWPKIYHTIISSDSIGYPRIKASGESSTTNHRLLHASGPHPIPPPNDPKTNQYNQDLVLIHSTNGNHLESPNEGSSIDHQVTIHLHAQNITMFPIDETWYFTLQMLVSSSGGLILILTAQSTRNEFRIHRQPCCYSGRSEDLPSFENSHLNTVNTYVATNKTIDARGEIDEPDMAAVAFAKKKSVSKKRPAAVSEASVVKKKRTSSGKAVSKEKDLAIVSVALDAEPIQTVDSTSAILAAHPPAPKRRAPKRKLRMTAGSDDEFVEKESAVETAVVVQKAPTSADNVDTIIEEVIAATAQMEQEDFVESAVEVDESPAATTAKDIDLATVTNVGQFSSDEELLSIDDLLKRIPGDMMLPSVLVDEPTGIKFRHGISIPGVADGDLYKASLPKIALTDKGKAPLVEASISKMELERREVADDEDQLER
ncbi:zinc finger protein [Dorcoceras hygrometricum]|uniref:Zinc finger protein n=1 Tax=Dorcoceras hygrometricum TaxID=472368 RepID=A0A2Z7C824_9LAMI|nr:zinc finger protein [Dorcoceras hygrometricum]